MIIRLWIADSRTPDVILQDLGTCLTGNPGRTAQEYECQHYADDVIRWCDRGYQAGVSYATIVEDEARLNQLAASYADYEAAVNMMYDEICEQLHNELAPCSDHDYLLAYAKAHQERFGEVWEPVKHNPVW